jgi:CRISPR-associated protein (TIGR02584 family)
VKPAVKPPRESSVRNPKTEIVLLAVTGMSPAVLTETVWALAQENPPVIPDRVIVLTTTEGRKQIVNELFTPTPEFGGDCIWDALRGALEQKGYDLSGKLRFGTTGRDLRVFTAAGARSGRSVELEDIRTRAQNDAAADFIMGDSTFGMVLVGGWVSR